jgi:hypothetical protein
VKPLTVEGMDGWILRTESCDFLSVLDQLHTDTLPDGRVRLLGLDADLLENDSLGVGGASEWRGLEGGSQSSLLVSQIGPSLVSSVGAQFAGRVQATRLSFTHGCLKGNEVSTRDSPPSSKWAGINAQSRAKEPIECYRYDKWVLHTDLEWIAAMGC